MAHTVIDLLEAGEGVLGVADLVPLVHQLHPKVGAEHALGLHDVPEAPLHGSGGDGKELPAKEHGPGPYLLEGSFSVIKRKRTAKLVFAAPLYLSVHQQNLYRDSPLFALVDDKLGPPGGPIPKGQDHIGVFDDLEIPFQRSASAIAPVIRQKFCQLEPVLLRIPPGVRVYSLRAAADDLSRPRREIAA